MEPWRGAMALGLACVVSARPAVSIQAWRVPSGGRRTHTKLAFKWHIGPAETIVHLPLHNVLARGVRAPDQIFVGILVFT